MCYLPLQCQWLLFLKSVVTLSLSSGAEEIQENGFPHEPVLSFNPTDVFPTASTCAIELTLPTMYSDNYYKFKTMMNIALTCHGGCGKT